MDAFRALLKDEGKLTELAAHHTMNAIKLGLPVTEAVTKEQVIAITEKQIAEHTSPDEPQRDYSQAVENMMAFSRRGNAERPVGHYDHGRRAPLRDPGTRQL